MVMKAINPEPEQVPAQEEAEKVADPDEEPEEEEEGKEKTPKSRKKKERIAEPSRAEIADMIEGNLLRASELLRYLRSIN